MPSNKNRLYIALYPTGVNATDGERRYHWAILIGPKKEHSATVPGARFHVKNSVHGWAFEEVALSNVRSTNSLLARILIAKIVDDQRLLALLRGVPVVQGDPNWRCRAWVSDAVHAIARDGRCVGTAELNWHKIESVAKQYVGDKIDAGRYQSGGDMMNPKPTWDMLENKESVP